MVDSGRRRKRITVSRATSITVESIAGYCMVSRSTVRRWIADGRLEAVKLPSGHSRVTVDAFRNFLVRNGIPLTEEIAAPDVISD